MPESGMRIAQNCCFPESVIRIINEYNGERELPTTIESAIVHMVDGLVKKFEVFDSRTMSSEWNQDMVIYQTLNEFSASGIYDRSGLGMNMFLTRDLVCKRGYNPVDRTVWKTFRNGEKMSLYMEEEVTTDFPFDAEDTAKRVTDFALEHEGFPFEAEINLTLTDNDGIRAVNQAHRGIDAPTDVLSFPLLSYETPGDFSGLEDDYSDNFNPDTGEIMLGDIIISVDKVKEQAKSYGHSMLREFAFLVLHSMLHLFGYDHMTEAEAAVMEEKQREILNELGILR